MSIVDGINDQTDHLDLKNPRILLNLSDWVKRYRLLEKV